MVYDLKINMISLLLLLFILQNFSVNSEDFSSPWHYKCEGEYCKKIELTPDVTTPLSLEVCQLFCGHGSLWPKPTGHFSFGNYVAHLDPDKIKICGSAPQSAVGDLITRNIDLLKENAKKLQGTHTARKSGGLRLGITIKGLKSTDTQLTLDTNENYRLQIYQPHGDCINATITAKSYFGVRHGLETLSQLIVYNDLSNEIQVVRDAYIDDSPVYPYRGILLDTSRNFMDKESILRTIEAMGMSKLNTFHWHITDSHSFPYVSKTWPNMSKYGAYSPSKIYTQDDVKEIVDFGLVHGVRVLPEFDAPAHVGEGWQWVDGNATVCFGAEPWQSYCVEPPCGQLNPTSDKVYEILEGIYRDMIDDFKPDIFHMGGDEVNIDCWNSSEVIRAWMKETKSWNLSEDNFIKLWDVFQDRAYDKLKLANGGKDIPVILWTSKLTNEGNLEHLDPLKYIIQVWTTGDDKTIDRLINNDFKVIFSNYDALYLDCGFGAWVGDGVNWCAPYKGWQKVYENSPMKILKQKQLISKKHLILGGEAALWSEQVDSTSVDSRLWPRSAAMAERLWGEPQTSWVHAEHRMLRHRERLVKRGIFADSLEPEWCLQNQGACYL